MRIIHLVPTYLPATRYGGPIQSVHNLNKELVRQGAVVTVLTTNIDGPKNLSVPIGKPVIIDGVEIIYFPTKFSRKWFFAPELFHYFEGIIEDFDLVHITSVFLSFSFFGARIARRHKKPYLISPRGSLMKKTFVRKFLKKKLYFEILEKKSLAEAAIVHLTSEAEKTDYSAAGFPARRISVIGNGLDISLINSQEKLADEYFPPDYFRKKFNLQSNQKIVICLGRIDWTKGFDDLIPAFASVIEEFPDAVLMIVGNDERGYRKTVEGLVQRNNLERSVIFAGLLEGPEKIGILKSGSVFVQASYSESFGMAVAEAMSVGLPIVATKGVAVASLVKETGSGLIVEKNKNNLAEALLSILRDPAKAAAMAENGRNKARKIFSFSRIAADFLALYNETIENEENPKR